MTVRRMRLILGAILVIAFALRLTYVVAQRSDPLFAHPVLDEEEYVKAAHFLVEGHGDPRPYWQPPGIIYSLAATFEFSNDLFVARLIQILISVASCGLVFSIGRRLFDARVGLVAAAITAVHGVLVFESYELLPATWIVFWDLLALWLLLRAAETGKPAAAFATGLALGISAIFSPTILPFVIVAAILVKKPVAIAAVVAGVILPIAPVTCHNHQHGELVLVSANGGLNLFLGNNADYDHTMAMRPGRDWELLTSEPNRHGSPQPGAASTYFTHRALAFAASHPVSEAALLAKKAYLFVNGTEIPRDTDIYAARSGVLSALVWPRPFAFPDALLIPLGILGIVALWRERRRLAAPLALLATLAITTIAFFVSSRHRAPALPLFAVFAAAGALRIATWAPRARGIALAALVAGIVVTNIPTWETAQSFAGEADFYRGLAASDPAAARAAFLRATEQNPHDARAWFELGNRLEGREAIAAWQHAADDDPGDPRALRKIVQALTKLGDLDAAIVAQRSAPTLRASDHMNLAFMLAQRDRTSEAIGELHAAFDSDEYYVRTHVQGLLDAARTNPSIAPEFIQALETLVP